MRTIAVPTVAVEPLALKYHQRLSSLEDELTPIREDMAELIKDAKADGVHIAALKLARRLLRMSPTARAEFLIRFDRYRINLRLEDQQALDLGGEPDGVSPPAKHPERGDPLPPVGDGDPDPERTAARGKGNGKTTGSGGGSGGIAPIKAGGRRKSKHAGNGEGQPLDAT
jgi:uncharacterized protein (UPF0335 family)